MITRKQFLKAKFPNLPYCQAHRTSSTQFAEGFHISNGSVQLNFWWRSDNTVSVSKVDLKSKNERTNNITLIDNDEKASMKKIIGTCETYLLPSY